MRGLAVFAGTTALGYILFSSKVPLTGRRAFRLVSRDVEKKMGQRAFDQIVREASAAGQILPASNRHVKAVERVGRRIIKAMLANPSTVFTDCQDELRAVAAQDWEFLVVDNPQPNAFVLPGGKVVVFTGILKLMESEDGMATVLSHEIGHVVARHSAEKLTWALIPILLGLVLGVPYFAMLANNILVNGSHSRTLEREADKIGIHLMAAACYEPASAAMLWKRFARFEEQMQKRSGVTVQPFGSTHPPSAEREANLRDWSSDAKLDFERSHCAEKLEAYQRELARVTDVKNRRQHRNT